MKLSEIIDVFIAGDWGNESPSLEAPHAVSCVRGADIVPISNNEFANIPLRYVSKHSFQQKLLQVGDIVIEKSGGSPTQSTGRAVYISQALLSASKDVVCSNFCVAFRVKEGWNSFFIYQYWQYLYNSGVFFNFEGKTSGIKNLQLDIALSAIEIEPYPIKKQISIANCLETFDEKITLNRALNHNLEVMAKQLYDYWFVQFDFPDEEGKPYKSSGGKMKYCEELQMEMPDGWNVCRLSEFVSKNNTGDWGTDNPSENSIEIGCIRGADIIKLNNLPKRYINSSNRAKLLSVWDVVIEVSGGSPIQATGRSAFITSGVIERNGGKITCSNFCHAFSFKDYRESAYFFYIWKMFYDNGIMFNYEGKTSGIKNFMTETFLANKWVRAPKGLIYKFFDTIKSVYAKIDVNITESNDLIKQRDELLPLLMNGQATVNYDLSAFSSVFSQTILSIARLAVAI